MNFENEWILDSLTNWNVLPVCDMRSLSVELNDLHAIDFSLSKSFILRLCGSFYSNFRTVYPSRASLFLFDNFPGKPQPLSTRCDISYDFSIRQCSARSRSQSHRISTEIHPLANKYCKSENLLVCFSHSDSISILRLLFLWALNIFHILRHIHMTCDRKYTTHIFASMLNLFINVWTHLSQRKRKHTGRTRPCRSDRWKGIKKYWWKSSSQKAN